MKIKSILIGFLVGGILVGGAEYYLLQKHNDKLMAKMKADYEAEKIKLQEIIDEIGPITQVLTVKEKVEPGHAIKPEELSTVSFPEMYINENVIRDPEEVVGKFYKTGMLNGTVLTKDLIMEDQIDDGTREYDLTVSWWTAGLQAGDYVDLIMTQPRGENVQVLTKVHALEINGPTIKCKLTLGDIQLYEAAKVDAYINEASGATLQLVKYVEPGLQKSATSMYAVPDNIKTIILANPDIIKKIEDDKNGKFRIIISNNFVVSEDDEAIKSIKAGRFKDVGKVIEGDKVIQEKRAEEAAAKAEAEAKAAEEVQ